MARNDGVEVRKARIQRVIQKIVGALNQSKDRGWIPLDTTIADIQYEEGLTEKRIMEYAAIGEIRGLYGIDKEHNQVRRTKADS
jgi:hypothetical protein